jgi:lipid-A-disaccharide synthase-like uncharacterized protein
MQKSVTFLLAFSGLKGLIWPAIFSQHTASGTANFFHRPIYLSTVKASRLPVYRWLMCLSGLTVTLMYTMHLHILT